LRDKEKTVEQLEERVQRLEVKVRVLLALVEAVGWATVAGVLTLILVLVPRAGGRILPHLFNVSHVALSAVVALVGYRLARRASALVVALPPWFPWVAGFGAVVVFGGGLEVAQMFVPGEPSWRDFAIDVMGGVAGLLLFVPPVNVAVRMRTSFWRSIGVLVAVAALAPSAAAISAVVVRDRRFPEIVRFEPRNQSFVYLRGGAKLAPPSAEQRAWFGADAVHLTFPTGGYAGVATTPARGDWGRYKYLLMPVFSLGDQPVQLGVRAYDFAFRGSAEDRFNVEVTLQPGVNELRFAIDDIRSAPQARVMSLDSMGYVALYSNERTEPVAVLLKPWKLE
jgi:hypothetical protein